MKIKKTKLFILSSLSVFGISLMVGSTFAQWAVTDNADPFSITVSVDGVPVEQGYYLTFESDNYSPTASSAVKMTSDSDNKAKAENITILDNTKVKIYYFDGYTYEDHKVELSYTFGTEHGFASISGNVVTFDTDRSGNIFSIYLNNNDQIYIADKTFESYDGYYITYADDNYAFRSNNKMDDTPSGNNVAQESVSIAANKSFRIEHFVGLRGIISPANVQAANYPHFTTSSAGDNTITIKEAATYKLMVSNDTKVYIANDALNSLTGFYITYSDSNYDYRQGDKMTSTSGTNKAEISVDIDANTTVKIIYVDAVNDTVSSTKYLQGDTGKSYLSTSINSETLTFNKTDTYDIYLGNDNKVYTAIGSYNTIYVKTSTEWNNALTNKKMIYFTDALSWNNINVYVFKASTGTSLTGWPGSSATYVGTNEYSQNVYSVEVDTSNYDSVIFNGGGSQTVDIDISSYVDSTQVYPNGQWENGKAKIATNTSYRPARNGPHYYAWVWETDHDGRWVALDTSTSHSGYLEMTIHSYETNMLFACLGYTPTSTTGSELNDYHCIYKTSDLSLQTNKNCYTISGTTSGSWSTLS